MTVVSLKEHQRGTNVTNMRYSYLLTVATNLWGPGDTPLYGLYRYMYVLRDRVWFLVVLILKY